MLEEPILKKKSKTKSLKKFIPLLSIISLVVIVTGISFAFFSDYRTGVYTHTITGGKLGVIFDENTGNNIAIANAYPLSDEEALTRGIEFEFTVTGYNESEEHVYYSVELVYGEDSANKTRFPDTDLKLSFYKNDTMVFENQIYDNLNNKVLDYGYIVSGTSYDNPTVNTYKLRMWINDNVMITNTPENLDTTGKSVYSSAEFINHYANFKINVNAEVNYDVNVVNYNLNGGIGAISPTAIGEAITLMKPSREGYIFAGWATTSNATEAQYQSGDIYNGDVTTLYAVWEESKALYETLEIKLSPYLLADDGDARIVSESKEEITNNYVWYSGKLWRIVALNNDGSIKLVTDENITTITWGADTTYSGSWMYQWLNEDFLDTLYNYENLLVTDYKWNATQTKENTKPAETTMVEGTVGLLNIYEYVQSCGGSSYSTCYLNNGYYWWLLTPADSSSVRIVDYGDGTGGYDFPEDGVLGARPSINLKSDIEISCTECDGSKTNPYQLVGDISIPTANELLNNRVSGEYVTFDNELYRIVSIENNITKITKVDYVRESSDTVITKYLASSTAYGASSNTKTDDYWDYYLNNTWYNSISSNYKNMIVSGTWYLGTYIDASYNMNYKNAICGTSNTTETTKSCTKTSAVYNGYVGLGRIGEMFTSQLGGGYSTSSEIWTITPNSSSSVHYVRYDGPANDADLPGSGLYGARPSVNLASNVEILGGQGTKESPFVIRIPLQIIQ